VGLFLGSATLDDTVAQLVLEVAGTFSVSVQPERDPLGLAGSECLRLGIQVGPQRQVNGGRKVGAGADQRADQVARDDDSVRRGGRWLRPEEPPKPRHLPSVRSPAHAPQRKAAARYRTRVASGALKPRLEWTGDPDADRLISENPTALLIGFCLDQQVPIEWAFMGPLRMQERLGTIDPTEIARMDPAKVEAAFRQAPALHRFPASMARRVYALCRAIADEYGGDPTRIWTEAADAKELQRRFAALPGFGAAKARVMVGVVAKHLRVRPEGWERVAPDWPTLADVSTVAEREAYQTQKRAFKAAIRAETAATTPAKAPAKQPPTSVGRGRR
jgi:uncharacterized HhH-GPD family protein